ncbi:collagen type IV alpha-3-binding protein-like [Acanthaster planci]|uniref:Collagen type IV alpha-3-binding protein-like n=1 Tax=Acanthaster planci TaxID=133434 RepID=A0A8B7YUX5_ACAPL|nr:collagen type IV alpha-3-binding protein-like [Acanthaster planci]
MMHDTSRIELERKMSDDPAIFLSEDEEEDDDSESDGIESVPELEDKLNKWTNYIHGWQDRWVSLRNGTLSYFKSHTDIHLGCRGSISLARADIEAHPFDELRFDVSINDNVWYLRCKNTEDRQKWLDALEAQKAAAEAESTSLQRQGSMLSLHSTASLASSSSFKKGRGLREKLAEMETFRDILCRQVDALQGYFDACAESAAGSGDHRKWLDDPLVDSNDDEDDIEDESGTTPRVDSHMRLTHTNGLSAQRDRDKPNFQPHQMGMDFKGEAFTFKATTAGILATLSHCIDLMRQREEQWQKRLEKEGPHSMLKEDEFFDAIDAALDIHDQSEAEIEQADDAAEHKDASFSSSNTISKDLPPHPHRLIQECHDKVEENIRYSFENIESNWDLLHQEGEMKIYKMEQEVDGIVLDPLKATHTVRKVTAHEMCRLFWDLKYRMDWDGTLDWCKSLETLAPDTFICHQMMRRVWPATQRDTCFLSHIRKLDLSQQSQGDVGSWIVVNYSVDHPDGTSKCIRAKINVCMLCQTFLDPPDTKLEDATRDNLVCKIYYVAHANPGGWVPSSVIRAVYKREYPKFLRRFSGHVVDFFKNKAIML